MALKRDVLKVNDSTELLSYIINVTPELAADIDLPVQGQSIAPIGKLIMNNVRYKNAFINTINLIGLTIIKRNGWSYPWDFTDRGTLSFGQQIRELILDLCKVYDYNEKVTDVTAFLQNEVPGVFNYIHELNFQKFYATTVSDAQLQMAFESGDLFTFIDEAIGMLYESWQYDKYIVNKYMLCRRLLDGTVTANKIDGYADLTPRQRVAALQAVSNKMTFRSPNYNPAGIRRATSFEDQILIVNTEFEADFSVDVLATSFFKSEAEMKARLVLCDTFSDHDDARLTEVLGDGYIPFTQTEKGYLANVPAVLISREWFMDYLYNIDNAGTKSTEFENPTTLMKNHFLHVWAVFSTSPFENAVVFTSDTPAVTAITLTPSEATVSAGLDVKITATVTAAAFANKAVVYSVESAPGVTTTEVKVDMNGLVHVPADYDTSEGAISIKATSVFDKSVTQTATITVA